ncbi:hypothetical protein BGZ73_000994, partial [Actinomortierella ambigua]
MPFSKTLVSFAAVMTMALHAVQAVPMVPSSSNSFPTPPANAFTLDGQFMPMNERVYSAE